MTLCIIAAGKTVAIAATAFTLSWTHSVQKTEWQEDWRIDAGDRLEIVEARIKGSGAGMEPPDGAVLADRWWTYRPDVPPRIELVLASSGATASAWRLCVTGGCLELASTDDEPVKLSVCDVAPSPASSIGLSQPR
jgi:hypothetical protein